MLCLPGVAAGGERRPGGRATRATCDVLETVEPAFAGEFLEIRELAFAHPLLDQPRVHPVEAEDHHLLGDDSGRGARAAGGQGHRAEQQGKSGCRSHLHRVLNVGMSRKYSMQGSCPCPAERALPDTIRACGHLGVDLGGRRIGLAISDASGVLARPLEVIEARGPAQLARVVEAIGRRRRQRKTGWVSWSWGCRGGSTARRTIRRPRVTAFVEALRARIRQPVVLQDERLSSVEAESRLAARDRDWRSRKKKLDAAAAAVILQDYLDEAGQKTEDRS